MSRNANSQSVITVCPLGTYIHRQPLAYPALAQLWERSISLTSRPETARILLVAHSKDLAHHAEFLQRHLQSVPDAKVVLLSEEPFWDTIWGTDPFTRNQVFTSDFGDIPFTYLNHHTSEIYNFDQIPYYLLTNHRFAARYRLRFGRNTAKTQADWQAHFAQAPVQAAFVAEKRLNQKFAVQFPQQDTYGLCRFRSLLTQAYQTGEVYRNGIGWRQGGRRQELTDWHLDKLQSLDQRCRFISALENTHQRHYVTEKFFDAFASGAVPLYYASPNHRVHELVPEGSWLNLYGLTPEAAVQAIDNFSFGEPFLNAYRHAQQCLAEKFCPPRPLLKERNRLQGSLIAELELV